MIDSKDVANAFHMVYFYKSRTCYLWTKRRLREWNKPRELSDKRFRVCIRYENITDDDIVLLFTKFINNPIEVNGNYCSFHLPKNGLKKPDGTPLLDGLDELVTQRKQELEERMRRKGSRIMSWLPEFEGVA